LSPGSLNLQCAPLPPPGMPKKLKILPAFLRGLAATYFHEMDDDKKDTYWKLTKSLTKVLCLAVDWEKVFSDFAQRLLCPNKDLALFLWEVKTILAKADPMLNNATSTALLSCQFMKSFPLSLRLKLLERQSYTYLERNDRLRPKNSSYPSL